MPRNLTHSIGLQAVLGLAMALPATTFALAQEPVQFRVGISAPVVSILPVYLAADAGFYEQQGLEVEIISSEGGTRGLQVLLSGEIQVMHVGLSPVVSANIAGADVRAIASTTNTLPITIFATEKTDPALPEGAVVGISTFGSETDIALTIALEALGMTREDVEITQIGGSSQRYAAMTAGRIDAAPLLEPGSTRARNDGFTPVYDLSASGTPWIFDAVVVTSDYLESNPEEVERFLRAYIESAYWALANEDEAKAIIAERFATEDPQAIDATYSVFAELMPRDAKPSIEGASNVIAQLQSTGVEIADEDVSSYVDVSMIEKLEAEGFFDELRERYDIGEEAAQ